MKKTVAYLSFLFVSIGVVAWARMGSMPQEAMSLPYVKRQASTPGIEENGHIHVSGTIIGGELVGGGAGLTGVNADLLDGLNSTAFLQSVPVPLSLVGNRGNGPILYASNAGGGAISAAGSSYGVKVDAGGTGIDVLATRGIDVLATTQGISVRTLGSGLTQGIDVLTNFDTPASVGVQARGEHGMRATGNSLGILAQSEGSGGTALAAYQTSGTGNTVGVATVVRSPNGVGVFSHNNSTSGPSGAIYARVDSNNGKAIVAWNSSRNGPSHAIIGESSGASGNGVFGYAGDPTYDSVGVRGHSEGWAGSGVYGVANNSDSAAAGRGVTGSSYSPSGKGVEGGVYAPGGFGYGVYGYRHWNGNGYGVYSLGDSGASGTKSFRIDHPFDPENRYLQHYSSESPFPQNFYVGNAVTDAKGYAWVDLPDYFAEINTNFKYQLTVVDDSESPTFVQVKIGKKIRGNRFLIMSSAPNVEVSWRVDADRNDLYVRNRKPKDEVEKPGRERGTYQHPELYGQPEARGLNLGGKKQDVTPPSTLRRDAPPRLAKRSR